MLRRLGFAMIALLLCGCGAHKLEPVPALPAIPDSMFYEQMDLSVGIWEEVTAPPESLHIGGSPSYIEPLQKALSDARLFEKVTVAPWQPTGPFDVLLKITDTPRIDLHRTRAKWQMGTIIAFLSLPGPLFWFEADIDSNLQLQSVGATEPLQIELRQRSHLEGKVLAFYGGGDERLNLARRHSQVIAGRLTAELIGRRKWFEQIAAAKKKGGEDPALPSE
ncbi:MAG: hypothetical protein KDH09_01520 [Chrysiogenetes bacterium]|nr:hypothetical protein [Chrysiogenetes bacterium]